MRARTASSWESPKHGLIRHQLSVVAPRPGSGRPELRRGTAIRRAHPGVGRPTLDILGRISGTPPSRLADTAARGTVFHLHKPVISRLTAGVAGQRVQTMRRVLAIAVFALAGTVLAGADQRPTAPAPPTKMLTVDSIMRGPKLVGTAPSAIRWSKDSTKVYFSWQRASDERSATWSVKRDGTGLVQLTPEEVRGIDAPQTGRLDRARRRALVAEGGDVVIVDVATGARRYVTRTSGGGVESALGPQRHRGHVPARRQPLPDAARSPTAGSRSSRTSRRRRSRASRPRRVAAPVAAAPARSADAAAARDVAARRAPRARRRPRRSSWLARAGARSDRVHPQAGRAARRSGGAGGRGGGGRGGGAPAGTGPTPPPIAAMELTPRRRSPICSCPATSATSTSASPNGRKAPRAARTRRTTSPSRRTRR